MREDGIKYEEYCCEYLQNQGYITKMTSTTGDQGVDIIAEKDGIKYAIQCKYRESGSIGNDAVQQVLAGKVFYDCDVAIVMTNCTFTPSAKELAKKLRVRLWDNITPPPETTLLDLINTESSSELLKECYDEAIDAFTTERQTISTLLTSNKDSDFVTTCYPIDDDFDRESEISLLFEKHSIGHQLVTKSYYYNQYMYLYRLEITNNEDFDIQVYKLSLELADKKLIVERMTTNLLLIVESNVFNLQATLLGPNPIDKLFAKAGNLNVEKPDFSINQINERDRIERQFFSRFIVDAIKKCLDIDVIHIDATKYGDTDIYEHMFFTEKVINEDSLKPLEDYWYQQHRYAVKTEYNTDHSFSVYVMYNNQPFDEDEESFLSTASNPAGIGDDVFVGINKNRLDDSIRFTMLLRNVDIDELLDPHSGKPFFKSTYFIWHDIRRYLLLLYEMITVHALCQVVNDNSFQYHYSGVFKISVNKKCLQLRVIDKNGRPITIEQHKSFYGSISQHYFCDSIIHETEVGINHIWGIGLVATDMQATAQLDRALQDEEDDSGDMFILNVEDYNEKSQKELATTYESLNKLGPKVQELISKLGSPIFDEDSIFINEADNTFVYIR